MTNELRDGGSQVRDVVERAKAALEGTTEGPWGTNGSMIAAGLVKVSRGVTRFKQSIAEMDDDAYLDKYEDDEFDGEYPPFEQKISDAEFIAQARTLVPELIAEVERLRPRGVETTADLEWLPENSVILTHDGGALQKTSRGSWYWANDDQDESLPEDLIDFLPARVLYIPTDSLEEA